MFHNLLVTFNNRHVKTLHKSTLKLNSVHLYVAISSPTLSLIGLSILRDISISRSIKSPIGLPQLYAPLKLIQY